MTVWPACMSMYHIWAQYCSCRGQKDPLINEWWATVWMLGIKPESSGRADNAFNLWVIVPTPLATFFLLTRLVNPNNQGGTLNSESQLLEKYEDKGLWGVSIGKGASCQRWPEFNPRVPYSGKKELTSHRLLFDLCACIQRDWCGGRR